MEWLKSWLLGILSAAVIAALAGALCPEGLPKRLTRLAGGLLLLTAALGPVRRLDGADLAAALTGALTQAEERAQTAAAREETRKAIIAQETAAYISDKAAALGILDPQVRVECRVTEDGFPVPEQVEVRGKGPREAWDKLRQALSDELALAEDAQTLEGMDVP